MDALKNSGLADAAEEIHIGANGGDAHGLLAASLAPNKSILHVNGEHVRSELPTLAHMRRWLPTHADWFVLYHHSKGVTQLEHGQLNNEFKSHHRRLMEAACVWNWRQCVKDLERGYDAVGINIIDPITRPALPGRFIVGNFWWATAKYLLELPALPDNVLNYHDLQDRCRAEGWIGQCPRRPLMHDYERPELSSWCNDQLKK